MQNETYSQIQSLLVSEDPEQLRKGLDLVREEISRVGTGEEARPLFEMVSTVFYMDPLDHPELAPVLDEAVSLVVGFGKWITPVLVENLDAGDFKAQFAIAHALGKIGADAIQPLIDEYKSSSDPTYKSFILFTLAKIKSPKIVQAAPLAVEAAKDEDLELRDTATRAIGKFAECIPRRELPEQLHKEFLECLHRSLTIPNAGIRAKAVRSLGKLARHGHLKDDEREQLKKMCELVLGIDENYEWDRAYIVRKEAQEAMQYV